MSEPPSRRRRLVTPDRRQALSSARSRSRLRDRSNSRHRPELDADLDFERLRLLEEEVRRGRHRLRLAEDLRASSRRVSQPEEDNRRQSTSESATRRDAERRYAERRYAERRYAERRDAERRDAKRRVARGSRQRDGEQRIDRSCSPTISKKDLFDIFKHLRDGLALPSVNHGAPQPLQKIDHKNILPNFDPSSKNQRMDVWLKKVNECASVYGWDERTTTHFAMQKLQGLAQTWYESLDSILFTWPEWQEKLLSAFPCEQNYGQALEDMIKRKSRYNESIEVYYYEKLSLVNRCEIVGTRAAECIIHGITDKTLKSGALALRCTHPDQLLQYLISNRDYNQPTQTDRSYARNRNFDNSVVPYTGNPKAGNRPGHNITGCYNCKERGHSFLHCPKPLLKCIRCNKVGHVADKCFVKSNDKAQESTTGAVQKTMRIDFRQDVNSIDTQGTKYFKYIKVNDTEVKAFIDFGSYASIIRESTARELGLSHDNDRNTMRGFGNGLVQSLGNLILDVNVDGVEASVVFKVVEDHWLDIPVLVGRTFTEQSHISVYKDKNTLQFLPCNLGDELPTSELVDVNNALLTFYPANTIEIYGAASVRVRNQSKFDGDVLLKSSVAGKPNEQYFITGGLHRSVNGYISVLVVPFSEFCRISARQVFCRAENVDVVSRVVEGPPSLVETCSRKELDETQVHVGEGVPAGVRETLMEMLRKYRHRFASSLKDLGCTGVTEMSIELNSQRPVVYRPYRLSHHEREKVRSMVGDMLGAGVIRESISDYASPIILVRKKDGTSRLCVDYRMLNSVTIKERYPMPIIEDEIARLAGQSCFVVLDLASGYYQVPISERSKHLTSFVTPDGQYEFNRMPFGLANAPAVFQRMINTILGPARFDKATAYIDDVLIYGKDYAQCLERLEEVLQMFERANLTLNLSKCEFLRDKVDYLGYEISASGIRPGEKKIASVVDFPRPQNVHNVRQFLGLASYFRKFIENFAQISFPLSKLLKKDVAWQWNEDQERAFDSLKSILVDRPVLAIYHPSAELELHTDASRLGIGGILLQRMQNNENFHPVAFYSRQTSPEEKNFHSYELETLAVVCSLRKFRVYLLGKEFRIVTDCSALRSTFSKRDLIPRIARWWLTLQEFNCSIEYRAGVKMSHVDALSRNPVEPAEYLEDQFPAVMSISSEDWLHTLQLGDTELCRIMDILKSDLDEKGLKYIRQNYVIRDNRLFRCLDGDEEKIRWVVPKGARWQVCKLNHDDIGHFGVEKTLERIRSNYYFPKMSRFVKKYVGACIECAYAKNNSGAHEGLLHPIEKVQIPFHTLHVDHLGPFVKSNKGFTHLLVIVDGFTKFCFLKPVRNTNTQNVVKVLDDIFSIFRNPDRLVSDRGSCFTSHMFKRFCLDRGIKHILNAVASPRSNGQVERYNRTVLDSLKALSVKHGEKSWDTHLGRIQWGLNNTYQKTIGRTPSEVLFGTLMNSEINPMLNDVTSSARNTEDLSQIRDIVKARIDQEQAKQKDRYDKGRKPSRIYNEGDLVKITKTSFNNDGQSKKLMPSFVGPYRVSKVLGNDRYIVAPIRGLIDTESRRSTTVAADRMKPWIHVASLEVESNNSIESDDDDNSN